MEAIAVYIKEYRSLKNALIPLSSCFDVELKTEQYFNDFKIREVMQNHADVVKKYKQKKLAYNNEYLDSVLQNTQNLFNNKEEMKAAIFGYIPHEEDIDKVALGKLHYDLAKEFGLREGH